MKPGNKPRQIWKTPQDISGRFGRLSTQINRLMILDHAWKKLVGTKENFWKLAGVKGSTLYVSVRLSVARNELITCRSGLIKELNKYFEKPWIKKIEIAKNLGASNE